MINTYWSAHIQNSRTADPTSYMKHTSFLFFPCALGLYRNDFLLLFFFIPPCLIFPMAARLFIRRDNITRCKWRVNMAGGRCTCCSARGKEEIFKLKKEHAKHGVAMILRHIRVKGTQFDHGTAVEHPNPIHFDHWETMEESALLLTVHKFYSVDCVDSYA